MYPDQSQPGQPKTPPPTTGGGPIGQNGTQNTQYSPQYGPALSQPEQYTQPQSYNTSAPVNPYAQPAPPQQAPENWYTPAPKPQDSRPKDANSYIQSSAPAQNPATGQAINGQYAVDYLGGIAPASQSGAISIGGFSLTKKMLAFIGGGIAALTLAMVLLFASQTEEVATTLSESSLYASYIDTTEVTKNSGKNITSSQLRSFNGSLQTFLLNSGTQMEGPLEQMGINVSSLRSDAKKPPYHDEEMAKKLEEARLLDTYDRVYASEVSYKLNTMSATIQKVKETNSRQDMQEYLETTEASLTTLQEALENYQNEN